MIVSRSSQLLGLALLVFVNVVWVVSAEITRYLFIDLDFKRPFFFTYAKSCCLSLFLLRFACTCPTKRRSAQSRKALYSRLSNDDLNNNVVDGEVGEDDAEGGAAEGYEVASLPYFCEGTQPLQTSVEYEPAQLPTDTEGNRSEEECRSPRNSARERVLSEREEAARKRKKVRFSLMREVRSLPEKVRLDARLARLPYKENNNGGDGLECGFCPIGTATRQSKLFTYSVYLAPLWLISSVAFQTSLAFTTVASASLISSSAPLFVLILGALFGRHPADAFNFTKLGLVLLNLGGVSIVSRFSGSLIGSSISLFSAFSNAVYLFVLARLTVKEEHVDMPLMLGVVGIFSLLVCTPLVLVLHGTGVESQLPLPDLKQTGVLLLNTVIGTLFADSVWLYATLLTGSLTSSISGSLGIPLSMVADAYFRNQPPNIYQVLSSIPIMISFIGASILTTSAPSNGCSSRTSDADSRVLMSAAAQFSPHSDRESLIDGDANDEDAEEEDEQHRYEDDPDEKGCYIVLKGPTKAANDSANF